MCHRRGCGRSQPPGHAVPHLTSRKTPKRHIFMSGLPAHDLERMRVEGLTEKQLLATAHRFGDRLRMFDLDALNLTCERILPLPFTYCVLESIYVSDDLTRSAEFAWLQDCYPREDLEAARDNPVIIHYAGKLGQALGDVPTFPPYYQAYLEKVPPALNTSTFRDNPQILGKPDFWSPPSPNLRPGVIKTSKSSDKKPTEDTAAISGNI